MDADNATLSHSPQFISTPSHQGGAGMIAVVREEYDRLTRVANQYSILCQNLMNGGLDDNTIKLLSNNLPTGPQTQISQDLSVQDPGLPQSSCNGGSPSSKVASSHSTSNIGSSNFSSQSQQHEEYVDESSGDISEGVRIGGEVGQSDTNGKTNGNTRIYYERDTFRSVKLANLPEDSTHADMTAVIRGGLILDIFIRRKDGSASISFVTGEAAQAFHDHIRKNDVYIKNKRLEASWCDRQYLLPGHVAHKINSGATRNFVVRHCDPSHTEASIREDLEHIHNLVVVKINFIKGDCYISTNSIPNAIYARTCMTSRLKYKGSRFEWDVDECAGSLDEIPVTQRRRAVPLAAPVRRTSNPVANRFQVLDIGDN